MPNAVIRKIVRLTRTSGNTIISLAGYLKEENADFWVINPTPFQYSYLDFNVPKNNYSIKVLEEIYFDI